MKPIKKIALLHSLCSVGKASITNMVPVLSVMGIEACPIPTIMLSTHTGGYGAPAKQNISPEYIKNCADHYRLNNVEFDAIFIGYLGNSEMLSVVRYFVEQFPNAIKILDPIMGDHGKLYALVEEDYIQSFRELIPLMDIILPNLTEACFLAGKPFDENASFESLKEICNYFHNNNVQQVIITSACMDLDERGIVYSNKMEFDCMKFEAKSKNFHGSGDVFDAVFVAALLQGIETKEAIHKAHNFVAECIEESGRFEYPTKEGLLTESRLSMLV